MGAAGRKGLWRRVCFGLGSGAGRAEGDAGWLARHVRYRPTVPISLPGPAGLLPGRVRIGCARPVRLGCWCECEEACSGHDATARRAGAGLEGQRQRERVGDEDVAREWERAGDFRLAWRRRAGGRVLGGGHWGQARAPPAPLISPLSSPTPSQPHVQGPRRARRQRRAHASPRARTWRKDTLGRTHAYRPTGPKQTSVVYSIRSEEQGAKARQPITNLMLVTRESAMMIQAI